MVRRRIVIDDRKPNPARRLNRHSMRELDYGNPVAERLLDPIAHEWLADQATDHGYNSLNALRTGLVRELSRRWVEVAQREFPHLYGILPPDQFRTIAFLCNRDSGFDGQRLENAVAAVQTSRLVAQATIPGAFSTSKLPATQPTIGAFDNPWREWTRGMIGICAELETAAGIDPRFVQPGQKVRMSQDFRIEEEIGGVRKQDADVSFVDLSGRKVLVEVAATIPRLRDKMGADNADQRARYEQVRILQHAVLAFATANTDWIEYFTGDPGTSIAERLPGLGSGWGLIIDGQYISPARLVTVAAGLRRAQQQLGGGFFAALRASGLRLAEVEQMQPAALSRRLQRYGQ